MSDRSRCGRWSASLVALALTLVPTAVVAQTTTPAQSPPGQSPPAPAPSPSPAPTDPPPKSDVAPPADYAAPAKVDAPQPTPAPEAAPAETPPPVHYPTIGPARELQINPDVSLKLGLQAQVWADSSQDSNREADGGTGDHQNNFFLRRGRILVGANLYQRITLHVLLESSSLGRATGDPANNKNFNPPQILDAWGEVKLHDAFMLEGGLMIVPVSRNHVMATTTYLGLDTGNTTAVTLGALQTSVLRDVGFQAKGQVFSDRFEYRLGVFSGIREAPTTGTPVPEVGAQNAPRLSGYFQYNFLDPEKGYVFHGTYYGKKKVFGVSSGVDFQKGNKLDPYYAISGAMFTTIPLNGDSKSGGDEIGAFVNYTYYDGQETARTIAGQNDILVEAGYFNKASKMSVFGKFEGQFYGTDATKVANRIWFGGGLKYHLAENLCNFTLAYNRSEFPNAPTAGPGAKNSTNQFTFAMQVFYY